MTKPKKLDFTIDSLGKRTIPSPLNLTNYTSDKTRVFYDIFADSYDKYVDNNGDITTFEIGGPREKLYFDPHKVRSAIVTCGGLCPGINDVIRQIVMQLYYRYNARSILGIRYGFQGFIHSYGHDVVELTPDIVSEIHKTGGTILGSSRGEQSTEEIVDALERMNVRILFCIGGDGTLRAAHEIYEEIMKRGQKIAVIGVPKTIDNDISYIEKSFGFETAFSEACNSIRGAHVEAKGAPNGIGIVKLMGRHSGFIAANAALAMSDVNYVLIPEQKFELTGDNGLLAVLEKRLKAKSHAVIVVAEGAGQGLFAASAKQHDASGNVKLKDIGLFLKDRIRSHFKRKEIDVNIKYIDPSYIIRSLPATMNDSNYCAVLAQMAVHAGMAGKTGMVVGSYHKTFVHIPISAVTSKRNQVDLNGRLWINVLEATGQPVFINDK